MKKRSNCCLIGIPDHEAVANLNGRLGAARGPEAFRQVFSRFSGPKPFAERLKDLGDARITGNRIQERHENAAEAIEKAHRQFGLSIVIGGSHDHGFSHLKAIDAATAEPGERKKKTRLGCINIDAHLDVRKPFPAITSGSPFYLAIESNVLDPQRFVEFGIQKPCNSPELWEYAKKKKLSIIAFEKLRNGRAVNEFKKTLKTLAAKCDFVVISLDLDAAAAAYAPGVSAPQAEGFTPSEIISFMIAAGQEPKVTSLGIFELNPEHDRDQVTARLAASSAYYFIDAALSR